MFYVSGEDMSYSRDPGNQAFTCNLQIAELFCCVKGYYQIIWYKYNSVNWTIVDPQRGYYNPKNDINQTLVIYTPVKQDEGLYRCVATDNKGTLIKNDISLKILGNFPNINMFLFNTSEVRSKSLKSLTICTQISFIGSY